MNKMQVTAVCVIWIEGIIACGSTTSDPIGGPSNHPDGGTGGTKSSSGGAAGATATGGASSLAGGVTGSGGRSTAGAGGASGGSSGGVTSTGGANGSGGDTATGGAGATGDAGAVACTYVHPNVNGSARTCNPGFCYCSGKDGCFTDVTASSCCKETVVCSAGAVNPVATIYHPGDGETRAANVAIPFSGVASDPQDGALTGASLVWTSSALAAPIGTGLSFQASLPAGTQVITLTATDSNSNTGTDTITLVIQ